MGLKERYESVLDQVSAACAASGRNPSEVAVMGVSKTVGLDSVAQAIEAGIHDFGENRPEELARKHDAFPNERWHFIGNIQSRQLRHVVGRACLIHSLCNVDHARRIDSLAADLGIVQPVLIEVNDGEVNKQGVAPAELPAMLDACMALEHIRVDGLMTMAMRDDADAARQTFADLRAMRDRMVVRCADAGRECRLDVLSMGMSDDFAQAIAEGSTMVRVGRAIFSDDYR